MQNYVPKIRYKKFNTTGNTSNGNPTINNIPDTTDIEVGMVLIAAGIPDEAAVISKTATTVTLDMDATATATGVALSFARELRFRFPPADDSDEQFKPKRTVTTAIDGTQQVSLQHIEINRKVKFLLLNQTEIDFLKTAYQDSLINGEEFDWYYHADEAPFFTYSLREDDFKQDRQTWNVNGFLYKLDMQMRRVA